MDDLPRALRRLRLGRGLTQADLGKRIEMSASSVKQYESGDVRPSLGALEKLLAALDADLLDLHYAMAGEEGPERPVVDPLIPVGDGVMLTRSAAHQVALALLGEGRQQIQDAEQQRRSAPKALPRPVKEVEPHGT